MAPRLRDRFHGFPNRAWVDLGVLTSLAALGILGFAPSFSSAAYLVAGLGGLAVGTAAGILAASLRLSAVPTVLLAVALYFLAGSGLAMPAHAIGGIIPSAETLSGLAVGSVFGWADIVTLTTPVGAPDYIGVLPYVAAWIVGVVNATLAVRWFVRHPRTPARSLVALAAPTTVYVASVLTGTAEPYLAALRGVAFALIALVWLAWRVTEGGNASLATRNSLLRGRLLGVGAIVAVAAIGGTLIGAVAAPSADDRFVLRERIEPPFDPLDYPSPLAGFRQFSKDKSGDPLFTVTGLPEGARIRIATMDSYDGQVWNVTSPDTSTDSSGTFGLVGARLPEVPLATIDDEAEISVSIAGYRDHWMPMVGYPREVAFAPAGAPASTALRYNPATGIVIDTERVADGQRYQALVDLPRDFTDEALQKSAVANIALPPIENVPELIGSKAAELAGNAESPLAALRAIEQWLSTDGKLSHGTEGEAKSPPGHGADRMKLLLSTAPMVGDEEQYASAFALMARSLGFPSRVVLGFAPESAGTVTVVGTDVSAWVEVAFADKGWIPFYPTPDASNEPQVETAKPQTDPLPQVRQPPRTDSADDGLVAATEVEEDAKAEPPFAIPGWVWSVGAAVAIPLAIYFVPLLLIAFLKARRRRARRETGPDDRRAAGAWDDLVDSYAELGYRAPRSATRIELALLFEQQFRDELEARARERSDAAQRAENKLVRAEQKRARVAEAAAGGAARPNLSSILEATVVRARDASTWRPGVTGDNDPLPVIPGLRDFAVSADSAVFSGREIAVADIDQLWSDADEATHAARRSVSWLRRRLSGFRFRPSRDLVESVADKINAAVPARVREVVSR